MRLYIRKLLIAAKKINRQRIGPPCHLSQYLPLHPCSRVLLYLLVSCGWSERATLLSAFARAARWTCPAVHSYVVCRSAWNGARAGSIRSVADSNPVCVKWGSTWNNTFTATSYNVVNRHGGNLGLQGVKVNGKLSPYTNTWWTSSRATTKIKRENSKQ